ncbi:hypothetical protein AJ88_41205 [Mesorhizobium amorphae CCBAU 01583]|nr:hypothetical protein AJ88_41205 [Mesorhizobium amorphae CCBAU 01583]
MRETLDPPGQGLRVQACGVDEGAGLQFERFTPGTQRANLHPIGASDRRDNRSQEGERRAGGFGVAVQRQHQRVAVDDAGRRRQQRAGAGQMRLKAFRLLARQQFEIGNAAALRIGPDRLQPVELRRFDGNDQLAGAGMADAALAAIGIEPFAPFDAEPRLQASRRIVDAGVDDFGIARTRSGADVCGLFDHQHFAAGQSECAGDGEADDTRPGNNAIDCVHRAAFSAGAIPGKV